MEKPIKEEINSKEKGYIVRLPIKMHNDLKLTATILEDNMHNIVLDAIEEKLQKIIENNERVAYIIKGKEEESKNIEDTN